MTISIHKNFVIYSFHTFGPTDELLVTDIITCRYRVHTASPQVLRQLGEGLSTTGAVCHISRQVGAALTGPRMTFDLTGMVSTV